MKVLQSVIVQPDNMVEAFRLKTIFGKEAIVKLPFVSDQQPLLFMITKQQLNEYLGKE